MKKIIALTLSALLCGAAAAEGYMGVDVGQGELSDLNLKGTGYNVYGGYRLNENVGFELGYRRVLSDDVFFGGATVKSSISGLQVSVVGFLPLGNDFTLFGRLGANNLKAKATGPGGTATEDETKTLIGVGMDYAISKTAAVRFEYQKPASDVSAVTLGVKFSF